MLWTVFLIVVVLGGGFVGFQWRNHARIEAVLATLRASGIATTPKELEEHYPSPPKGENAADTYQKAFNAGKYDESAQSYNKVEAKITEESKSLDKQKRFSEALRAMMREYLDAHADALNLLHEAVQYPACRYPLDFSDPINTELNHLAKLRQSVRLLMLEAMLAAEDKDFDKAVEAIHAMLAASDSIRLEPILISQLTRSACLGLTCEALRHALIAGTFTEEQLGRLRGLFANQVDPDAFSRGLQGEYLVGMALFDRPERMADFYKDMFGVESYVPGATRVLLRVASITGWTEADRVYYLGQLGSLNAISRMPMYEAIPAMHAFEEQARQTRSWVPTISGMIGFPLGRARYSFGRDQARVEFASIAIAAERYRLFASKYPDTLNELVPSFLGSMPQDPFDGQPLRYRRTENGYLLYSVGYNQRDDNGVDAADIRDRDQSGDIIFRIGQ